MLSVAEKWFCKLRFFSCLDTLKKVGLYYKPHWEELLQSVSDFIFSKHCGYRSMGLKVVKRSEILWEIQKYSLPGRPSSQNWVKSKTICQFLMKIDAFLNVFLILLNFGWMVDLAMSIFEFLNKFLIFWHPWHPWVCIRSDLKPLFETDIRDSSYCDRHFKPKMSISRLHL